MLKEKHPRQELLNQISTKSQLLADQLADFKNIMEDRKIVSFYERQQTGHLQQDPTTKKWKRGEDEFSTAVDEESALLQFPDRMEAKIPVDADHSNMVKFDSKSNQTYSSVVGYLKDFAANAGGVVSGRFFSDGEISPDMKLLGNKASNCTDLLYKLRGLVKPGTCQWIFDREICPRFFQWDQASKSDFLLIAAPPGYGKSVMCAFLEGHFQKRDSLCLYFFCDDKSDSRRTELQILRTIVYQLTNCGSLAVRREITRRVLAKREKFKIDPEKIRGEPFDSSEHLWEILMSICAVMIPGIREIRCIIDALDECEPESRKSFLRRIRDFYTESPKMSTFLKFVTSSRSYPEIISQLPQTDEIRLNATGSVGRDVEGFIEIECEDMAERYSLSNDFVSQLSNMLKTGADGMFLWATLSMDVVRTNLQAWAAKPRPWDFSPSLVPSASGGLDSLFSVLLFKLHPVASTALKWATLSLRPLTKAKIACINQYNAESDGKTHRSFKEHELDCSPLGYFDGEDSLHIYHQSIKDHIRNDVITQQDLQLFAGACVATLNSPVASSLYRYSRLYWFEHITPTIKLDEKLLHQIRQLFCPEKRNFETWLEHFPRNPGDLDYFGEINSISIHTINFITCPQYWIRTEGITPPHLAAWFDQRTVMEKPLSSRNRWKHPRSKVLPWYKRGVWHITRTINLTTDQKSHTALTLAAMRGHETIVKLLLDSKDVQADSKDKNCRTPLSYAAEQGQETIFKLLLAREDVQAGPRDNDGRTPLSRAAKKGHETIVKLLLGREDVQADSKDKNCRTPLSHAAEQGREKIVKLFLDREDVQADSKDKNGRTPLSYAADWRREATVKLLMDREDVQADSKDNNGRTPLSYASKRGNKTIVELLLAHDEMKKQGGLPLVREFS